MTRYFSFLLISAALFSTAVFAQTPKPGNLTELTGCAGWAAEDLIAVLKTAGTKATTAEIHVEIASDVYLPESFEISVDGTHVLLVANDEVGAMYGLQEIAEQISNSHVTGDWEKIATAIHATKQKPFLEIRADNAFIHTAKDDRLFDVPMWEAYIDMLARSRYNMLDLHGLYDVEKTTFPSIYPLLVHVAEYPAIGNEETQKQNLDDFKTIITHAKARGVKVGFMNYAAKADGVDNDHLADYTAKAVANMLRALPDLAMAGFRIGETGQKEDFFRESYLKGIADSGRRIPLYTRSWLSSRAKIQPLAEAARDGFFVEIKYNGEQLGLPYQAMHGDDYKWSPTYSYEDYLDLPKPYGIIWQVRANGTHRFWAWEQTGFIRRAVKTFRLGDARGFSLEPQIAYFPYDDASYYAKDEDKKVYKYIWEKYWMWYLAWGRLSYNPELPEETLVAAFEKRFGQAGKDIYKAMQDSGWIVPLIMAYRDQGPDHRDFSPETETGLGAGRMDNHFNKHELPLLRFGRNVPMDSRNFMSPQEWVDAKLGAKPDGRIGPLEMYARFTDDSAKTTTDLQKISGLSERAADEWRLLLNDLASVTSLADYYAARTFGITDLLYALQTDSESEYKNSVSLLAESRDKWKKLADFADATFSPLPNPLRKQNPLRWSNELKLIDDADATIESVWAARQRPTSQVQPGSDIPLLGRLFRSQVDQHQNLAIEDLQHSVAGNEVIIWCKPKESNKAYRVLLWYKELPSTNNWQSVPMKTVDANFTSVGYRTWAYTITLPHSKHGLLYQVEVQDEKGAARLYPNVLEETPYRVVEPF